MAMPGAGRKGVTRSYCLMGMVSAGKDGGDGSKTSLMLYHCTVH